MIVSNKFTVPIDLKPSIIFEPWISHSDPLYT